MSTRIILCRHGNTFDKGDVITRVGARTDLPLSKSGQVQAQRLQTYFEMDRSGFNFTRAFCSELRRTRETAETILTHHPAELLVKSFLREIDYGVDENKAEAEVVARIGDAAIKAWDTSARVPKGWHVDPAQIRADWSAFLKEMSNTPGDVLIVTSNGIARFVLDVVDDITCKAPSIKLATAAFGIISCDGDTTTLTDWNVKAS